MLTALWKAATVVVPVYLGILVLLIAGPAVYVAVKGKAETRRQIEALVAGERIAGLEATIAAKDRIAAERGNQLMAAGQALNELRISAALFEREKEDLDDQIAELLARPVGRACTVDRALLDRMRAR